ncbi:hypothetical protein vseg_011496 [Gypsophila vaccaria]
MARKSNLQKQRELNLRGRSVLRSSIETTQEVEKQGEGLAAISSPIPTSTGPSMEQTGKMKDIHAILGMPELLIETKEEEETDDNEEAGKRTRTEHKPGKQRTKHRN